MYIMVVIQECVNVYPTNNYTNTSFITDYIYIGNATLVEFLAYSSSPSAVLSLNWSSDAGATILKTDSLNLTSNSSGIIQSIIKSSYVQMSITGLTNPCTFQSQGQYFI